MFGRCHGADNLRRPTLEIKTCPECGNEIEIFSIDKEMACDKCGFVVYNDVQSCVDWCKYARLCIGDELYGKIKKTSGSEERS